MTKKTFLHEKHVELGARMVDFAGWHMPVQYTSIIDEHRTVREFAGLFDVSHMGEIIIKGKDALCFLNSLVPRDISLLSDYKAVYTQLMNFDGGMVDDLIIYKIEDNKYLVIANASRKEDDINWMSLNKSGYDVDIIDESHNYSLLAVQGPKAVNIIEKLGVKSLPEFFSIKKTEVLGKGLWISRTGYTGEDGVELLIKNQDAVYFWEKILEYGQEYGIKPIGLGARDTLRLEAALPLYGNELDETTTPVEAGLGWSVSKKKDKDYIGKNIIFSQLENGTERKLVGFKMIDKGIARHGYEVYYNNIKIGQVTSGGVSPSRGDNIGLAYVKTLEELCVGVQFQIKIREKLYKAELVKLPFIEKKNKV